MALAVSGCGARIADDDLRRSSAAGSVDSTSELGGALGSVAVNASAQPVNPPGAETAQSNGGSNRGSAPNEQSGSSGQAAAPVPSVSESPWLPANEGTTEREAFEADLRSGAPQPNPKAPSRPADYQLPLPGVGEPGWRGSTEPFCDSERGKDRRTVLWADDSLVAALTHATTNVSGSDLRYNDGTGWRWLLGMNSTNLELLTGFPGGQRLLVGGMVAVEVNLDGSLGLSVERIDRWPHIMQGIDAEHAAIGFQGCGRACGVTHVAYRRAEGWGVNGFISGDPHAFWASNDLILLPDSRALRKTSQPELRAFRAGDQEPPIGVRALVGQVPEKLWVFSEDRLTVLLWNNETLTYLDELKETPLQAFSDGEQAYFVTPHGFGRIKEHITPIAELDPEGTVTFESITGNSKGELFLALHDSSLEAYACGGELVVMYDGAQFHLL